MYISRFIQKKYYNQAPLERNRRIMSRPEHTAPPEVFYNEEEAKKYTSNTRMIEIQSRMCERALELLNLPEEPCLLLDVGCGSGLSGSVISEHGHMWIGMDISQAMLNVATEQEVEGDVLLSDMGCGVPLRPGTIDGVVSISALQWLCNSDKRSHNPRSRMMKFFRSLFACLRRGARAVFQLYPETPKQMELLTSSAFRCGFHGGLVVDYPNSTKAKKFYLCLFAGEDPNQPSVMPKGLNEESQTNQVQNTGRRKYRKGKGKVVKKSREWILNKKETQRKKGVKHVRPDSKYTGRKRNRFF